jgi:RNA polymerase sigma-70 factor, ECF subfamily
MRTRTPLDEWDRPREQAIPRLLDMHGGRLYGLALRLCKNPQDAEDLVQETFLQAFRKWDQFAGRSTPMTWLYTIAARLCQRLHRRRAGEPKHMESWEELLPFGERKMAVLPSSHDDHGEGLLQEAGRERVEEAIVALPVTFRLPLVLKEIVGLSVVEVAEILGLKEATVKTRVHRARLRLRQAVEAGLPLKEGPPPLYSKQVCLDLLRAKQEALDRGVEFPQAKEIICERCHAVFATMDLAQEVCKQIGDGELPEELRQLLLSQMTR